MQKNISNVLENVLYYLWIVIPLISLKFTESNIYLMMIVIFFAFLSYWYIRTKKNVLFEFSYLRVLYITALIFGYFFINTRTENFIYFFSLLISLNFINIYQSRRIATQCLDLLLLMVGMFMIDSSFFLAIHVFFILSGTIYETINALKEKRFSLTTFLGAVFYIAMVIIRIRSANFSQSQVDLLLMLGGFLVSSTIIFIILSRNGKYLLNSMVLLNALCLILFNVYFSTFYLNINVIYICIILLLLVSLSYCSITNTRVIFVASAGGHLTQLLKLSPIYHNYNSILITEFNEVSSSLEFEGVRIVYLLYGSRFFLKKYVKVFFFNFLKSLYIILFFRPSIIVTTGTHTAIPLFYWGKLLLGSKLVYVESFAKQYSANLAGKLAYPISDKVVVQWRTMLDVYPIAENWEGIY